jgi:two-component system, OmpR family, phosphate regulon sensor histidine kinase PhoR
VYKILSFSFIDRIIHTFKKVIIFIKKSKLFRSNRFWIRALICWTLSAALLKFDAIENYDTRFKIRGPQQVGSSIVLVTINTNDFAKASNILSSNKQISSLVSINELNNTVDTFYWDSVIWSKMLKIILNDEPQKIGVCFYFGDILKKTIANLKDFDVFQNSKIIWGLNSSMADKTNIPFTSKLDRSNIGNIQVTKDDDSVVRRLLIETDGVPNLAAKLTDAHYPMRQKSLVINYAGNSQYHSISFSDVLNKKFPTDFFKNKIIIIGAEKNNSQQILTPLGQISRHEFWAEVTHNYLHQAFIQKLPIIAYIVLLFLLMLLAVFIITRYPQTVSFFIFLWIATLWTAFSIWTFDTYDTWIPIASAYALLILIWLTHIGYQALIIEKAHYKLQQEQNYFSELEQLKNNFVSLISHDLKTPIAKIQAVVDRLSLQNNQIIEEAEKNQSNKSWDLSSDLKNLKDYSEELNKYIQSILKLLRVESKEFRINKETADLNGIIENVLSRVQPLAQAKEIQIHLNLEPMFLIELDITLMTEVILNLVENAIKYTPNKGKINIHSSETETHVLVEIKDTGEGISQDEIEIVWKKFTRGKNQDLKTKGTGLGLYLSKYFIELHGGKISLQSTINQGTTFLIELPIEIS